MWWMEPPLGNFRNSTCRLVWLQQRPTLGSLVWWCCKEGMVPGSAGQCREPWDLWARNSVLTGSSTQVWLWESNSTSYCRSHSDFKVMHGCAVYRCVGEMYALGYVGLQIKAVSSLLRLCLPEGVSSWIRHSLKMGQRWDFGSWKLSSTAKVTADQGWLRSKGV